ncbi:MAG: hypothetical protein JW735_01775 [Prolixibacteraceae bacterium]|jgi:uncharacterized protein YkwD|nr:hypothetical protein [Prolixibacteraceae bacterium]
MNSKIHFTTLLFFLVSIYTFSQNQYQWPIKELDTAREASYLSEKEKDIILEMNMVRHNPTMYAEHMMKWMEAFYDDKKMLTIPGKIPYLTNEGKEAYLECMEELRQTAPAPVMKVSHGMSKACKLLLLDQGTTGRTGHKSSSNTTPGDRLKQFGTPIGYFAENIHYGDIEPRFVVISLLIDDGVKSRGHRKTLLSNNFNFTGVAMGDHKTYGGMCVITYAQQYQEK